MGSQNDKGSLKSFKLIRIIPKIYVYISFLFQKLGLNVAPPLKVTKIKS